MLALNYANVENAIGLKSLNRLVDQRQGRDAEQNLLTLCPCHVDDGRSDDGLTRASGGLNNGPLVSCHECLFELVDCCLLIVSQFHCSVPVGVSTLPILIDSTYWRGFN